MKFLCWSQYAIWSNFYLANSWLFGQLLTQFDCGSRITIQLKIRLNKKQKIEALKWHKVFSFKKRLFSQESDLLFQGHSIATQN